MKAGLAGFFTKPSGKYLIVGGTTYLVEILAIIIAQALGASIIEAIGISFWLGLVISFLLQKLVTFGDKRARPTILIPQILAFCLLVLFNFGFTLLVSHLLQKVLPAVIIRTIALAITTIWNFYLYKTKIFRVVVID